MIQIRPANRNEITLLHSCFEASVRGTCNKDYNSNQINAWINKATHARWQELFNSDLHFFVAIDKENNALAGFTSINITGYLHSLFVDPAYQHQGIAKLLVQTAEYFAEQNGAESIHSEVSLTAKPFFEKMGYIVDNKQVVVVNNIEMANYKMKKVKPSITLYTSNNYQELTCLWESSVRSSHHFLTENDIEFYKELVPQYFPVVSLYITQNQHGKITAFLGLSDDNIEMLFIHPDEQGKGLGKQLLHFAIQEKNIHKVDVNEQNTSALHFYQYMGFQVIGRDETDSSGKPFPILHMQLRTNSIS